MAKTFLEELFEGIDNPQDLLRFIEILKDMNVEYKEQIELQKQLSREYEKQSKKIVESLGDMRIATEKLDESTEEGRKEIDTMSKSVDTATEEYKDLNKSVVMLEGSIDGLTKEQEQYNKKLDETTKSQKELQKLQKKLTDLNREDAQEIAKVKVQIQERNKELRENAKETLGVIKTQSLFSKNQDRIAAALENTGPAFQTATQGAKGLLLGFRALLANPIGVILTAIVAALGFLFSAFTKTVGGAEGLERVLSALSTTFDTLVGRIGAFLNGEISFRELLFETGDAIEENVRAGDRLVRLRRELERGSARLALAEATLGKEISRLTAIRDADSKSLFERRKAAQQLQNTLEDIGQRRIALLREEQKQALLAVQREVEGTEARREANNDFLRAKAAVIEAETQLEEERRENLEQLALIELDIFEQRLDLLIDIDNKRREINQKAFEDERTTLKERERLLFANADIVEQSFQKQIALFEQLNGVTIDQQRLINASGEEIAEYARSLGFAERATNRLREVVIEKNTADRDQLDLLRELQKETNKFAEISSRTGNEVQKPFVNFQKVVVTSTTTVLEDLRNFVGNVQFLFGTAADAASGLFGAFQARREQEFQDELSRSQQRTEQLLSNTRLTAEQRERIVKRQAETEKRLEKEQAERNRRAAIFEKSLAVTQSIINTAVAVTKLLDKPFLAIAAGIAGAAQTAAIIAEPIPTFAKGTFNAPGGLAIAGEAGREIHISKKTGQASMINSASLIDTEKGDVILKNSIVENMLRGLGETQNNNGSAERIRKKAGEEKAAMIGNQFKTALRTENTELVEAIASIIPEVHQWNFRYGKLVEDLVKGHNKLLDIKKLNNI